MAITAPVSTSWLADAKCRVSDAGQVIVIESPSTQGTAFAYPDALAVLTVSGSPSQTLHTSASLGLVLFSLWELPRGPRSGPEQLTKGEDGSQQDVRSYGLRASEQRLNNGKESDPAQKTPAQCAFEWRRLALKRCRMGRAQSTRCATPVLSPWVRPSCYVMATGLFSSILLCSGRCHRTTITGLQTRPISARLKMTSYYVSWLCAFALEESCISGTWKTLPAPLRRSNLPGCCE